MSTLKRNSLIAAPLAALILSGPAVARPVSVDSGDWTLSAFASTTTTQSIGFAMNIFEIGAPAAPIAAGGAVRGGYLFLSRAIPEPSSLALLGVGLLAVGVFWRRKRSRDKRRRD